ncbi:MAG: hypothetical protein JWQ05_1159 [Methylobacterium sp.]|nr:hypothetical protein [Methylobacterium sp.]
MTAQARHDPTVWHPQQRLVARISSPRQLQVFNDRGGIAVNFDVMRSTSPAIEIVGGQSQTLCLWETRSASGFVTKPKFNADLVTIRFVTSGQIVYRHRGGDALGSPTHATLVAFDELREVQASHAFSAISGTIAVRDLVAANAALTGGEETGLPPLASVAEVSTPAMKALFCTLTQVQRRSQDAEPDRDFLFPLIQEVMGYQLLSAWPKRAEAKAPDTRDVASRSLDAARDYIEANLSMPMTLADIAAAAGISVRSLQNKFRRELGQTPVQFITDRRLTRAHQDLVSSRHVGHSVADIAGRWGFVHMSDFGQRYRRLFGCTPSGSRREAHRRR